MCVQQVSNCLLHGQFLSDFYEKHSSNLQLTPSNQKKNEDTNVICVPTQITKERIWYCFPIHAEKVVIEMFGLASNHG